MTPAELFVNSLYARFLGRAPVAVAGSLKFRKVYPLVVEDSADGPIGLLGCFPAAKRSSEVGADVVAVPHLSGLIPNGESRVSDWLASEATLAGVRLQFDPMRSLPDPPAWPSDGAPGQAFVGAFLRRFPHRVPLMVGYTSPGGYLYPSVVDAEALPIGLVGCGWNEGGEDDLVQIYHVSALKGRQGDGTRVLRVLCDLADQVGARLYVQAEPLFGGAPDPYDTMDWRTLDAWYRRQGFSGSSGILIRP